MNIYYGVENIEWCLGNPVVFTEIRRSANDVTFGYRDVSYARGSGCNAVTSIYLISQYS